MELFLTFAFIGIIWLLWEMIWIMVDDFVKNSNSKITSRLWTIMKIILTILGLILFLANKYYFN